MHRTNLYLTDEQEQALDRRARAAGISRSALVRIIIDRELANPLALSESDEQALAELAGGYHESFSDLFDDDPDLRIER